MASTFHPGERAPCTGLFKATHAGHSAPHDITLLFGEVFPLCLTCGTAVRFELALLSVHAYAHPLFVREP